jgi:response regulator RpfG family c-di-GMP phosphodiesterase
MHDVGKLGIPDAILLKPGKLSHQEYEILKHHTDIGYEILKNSKREIMKAAVFAAQQHHERWDGTGYPKGLKGEEIHINGRITALADVFDALIHKRIYKDAWEEGRVFEFIKNESGRQFDPKLVDNFIESADEFITLINKYPDGAPN